MLLLLEIGDFLKYFLSVKNIRNMTNIFHSQVYVTPELKGKIHTYTAAHTWKKNIKYEKEQSYCGVLQ